MPVSTTFVATGSRIHNAEGYLFWNILRPLFGLRPVLAASKPATVSDPANPGSWVQNNAYTATQMITDTNNNVQVVVSAGTSAGSQPTWPTIVGTQTVDGTVTWQLAGPSWIWAKATAVIYDQQIRDPNGNIQQCISSGTTGSSQPTWPTTYNSITVDGTAYWMNLGATYALGATEGALVFKMTPKIENLMVDQYTAPLDFVTIEEDAAIDGTLAELTMTNLSRIMPNTSFTSGTDTTFPTGAQSYEEVTFGGSLRVPRPCVGLFSPRRQYGNSLALSTNPFRYLGGVVYACGAKSDGTLPISLKKMTTYKVAITGSAVTWRPGGDVVGKLFMEL